MREIEDKIADSDWAEQVLSGPLSEDLPDNIEAIEAVVGRAYLAGDFDLHTGTITHTAEKLDALLKANRIRPTPDWDMRDLAEKIGLRFITRQSTWDFGLGEKRQESLSLYERLKDRPAVQEAVSIGGLCQGVFLVIRSLVAIDEALASGASYNDVYCSIIYSDDEPSNHAFLSHVEERTGKRIDSPEKLHKAAALDPDQKEDVELCYLMAQISRYRLALDKVIREGGMYRDLLAVTPTLAFDDKLRQGYVRRAIFDHFNLDEPSYQRPSLREVAESIEAPYSEVLRSLKDFEERFRGEDKGDGDA